MTDGSPELPELVRRKLSSTGSEGQRWLQSLPDLIATLEDRWDISVGRPLDGGSTAFVAEARRGDGTAAVLKLTLPGEEVADQVDTLARAKGHGYVRLLKKDVDQRAMLLEALGPSLDQLGLSPEQQIDRICATLKEAWLVPCAPGQTVQPEEEKAHALGVFIERIWHEFGQPCSERVITQALAFADRRAAAFDLDTAVVVHGDPHPANALQVLTPRAGAASGYVFVDPDGFLSDRGYDLGVVLRDWCTELRGAGSLATLRGYCAQLADRTGVDFEVIWEWGFVERVSTGLYLMNFGAVREGETFLETAESLL